MFKPSSYFYVKFQNVNGLTKSSPVFADGFRVGIVRDLYYDYTQPGKVVAEIDVDPELRIPKGSTAELAAEMLGGVKMNLLLANNPREKYQIATIVASRKLDAYLYYLLGEELLLPALTDAGSLEITGCIRSSKEVMAFSFS